MTDRPWSTQPVTGAQHAAWLAEARIKVVDGMDPAWQSIVTLSELVASAITDDHEGDQMCRFVVGLQEMIAALAALCATAEIKIPDVDFFCCCGDDRNEGTICVIHGGLAVRRSMRASA